MLKLSVVGFVVLASCATTGKPARAPEVSAARVPTSAAERVAAQRAADPKIDHDAEEGRWGLEEAQARKRAEEEKREAARRAGAPGADVTKAKNP